MTTVAYSCASRIGTFLIRIEHGRWAIWCNDERLSPAVYGNPQAALDDLVGGHTDWPGTVDPSTLSLPDDIGDWFHIRQTRR